MSGNSHLSLLCAEIFLPYADGISTGRQVSDGIFAVFGRHCEIGVVHNPYVSVHPAMNVAFHSNHDFRLDELSLQRRVSSTLTMVPFPVDLGHGMNVMRDWIGI